MCMCGYIIVEAVPNSYRRTCQLFIKEYPATNQQSGKSFRSLPPAACYPAYLPTVLLLPYCNSTGSHLGLLLVTYIVGHSIITVRVHHQLLLNTLDPVTTASRQQTYNNNNSTRIATIYRDTLEYSRCFASRLFSLPYPLILLLLAPSSWIQ